MLKTNRPAEKNKAYNSGKPTAPSDAPEFSRLILAEHCRAAALHHQISASPQECAALAARFDLLRLSRFEADLTITRQKSTHLIRVQGKFTAELVQQCVVSLVEIPQNLSGQIETNFCQHSDFAEFFTPAPSASKKSGVAKIGRGKEGFGKIGFGYDGRDKEFTAAKHALDLDFGDDDVEEIIDGKIDLGELAAQYLGLALDPFPRADGAEAESDVDPLIKSKKT
ncbi:MAG: hypothetical protein ORN98_11550 [Alphaproteobacteria bacterium]|nr:hypothetical protein [Alphaproteobacteria bacterium]